MPLDRNHPLRRLFADLVTRRFYGDAQVRDARMTNHVSALLTGFTRIVSSFDVFEYRDEAGLFRQLSDRFESCVYGLNFVKQDLENWRSRYYQRMRSTLQ